MSKLVGPKENHENLKQIFFQEKRRTLEYYQHLNRQILIYGSPFENMLQYLLCPCFYAANIKTLRRVVSLAITSLYLYIN